MPSHYNDVEELEVPLSAFERMRMDMDPEEMNNLMNPESDAPDGLEDVEGRAGEGLYPPASTEPPAPFPTHDGPPMDKLDAAQDPNAVREDLRAMLREREMKRKDLQDRYAEENLSLNRGNL